MQTIDVLAQPWFQKVLKKVEIGYNTCMYWTHSIPEHANYAQDPILTSRTIFHSIRMYEFSLLKGVTVVILATFGEIGL